jgi:hypothetical protein
MPVPPVECERRVSSLERRDRVLVSFLKAKVVTLREQAGGAEPFLVGRYCFQRWVQAVYVKTCYQLCSNSDSGNC